MTVRDLIIELKYDLRHHTVSDELVEQIDQKLHHLRVKYKEDRHFFSSEDILFLKSVNVLLRYLEAYVRCEDKIPALRGIQDAFQAFHSVRSSMDDVHDETFAALTQQIDVRYHTLCGLLNTMNDYIQSLSEMSHNVEKSEK